MTKTILTFGTISGFLCALIMASTVPIADKIGFDRSVVVGYTILVASFLLVFFGVRSYRDNAGNGQITFAKAFVIGISITLITCVFYVVTWEILYFNFLPGFMDKYSAYVVERAKVSGESQASIRAKLDQLAKSKELYSNPLWNAAITFLEPFPVGLAITLLSAGFLRKQRQPRLAQPIEGHPSQTCEARCRGLRSCTAGFRSQSQ